MYATRVLATVMMSDDGMQRGDRRTAMESFGDAMLVMETTARPGTSPTARWYAQWWEEPRATTTRPAAQYRVRHAIARALLALADTLAPAATPATESA
jgi:hypothetical protein